jgi:hypothetical protein
VQLDLREACHAVFPVDHADAVHAHVIGHACATARNVNRKQDSTAPRSSNSGLQASPGPPNSSGVAVERVGTFTAESRACPEAAPVREAA